MWGLLVTFLLSFAGIAVLYAGPFLLLGTALAVSTAYGRTWGFAALAVACALCLALMWNLTRLAERRTGHLDLSTTPPPRDLLFCQRCGTAATVGSVVCTACGAMAFGLGPPAALVASPGTTPP